MKKLLSNKKFIYGLSISSFFILLAAVGYFVTPYNPNAMDNASKFAKASFKHLMGCDNFGRDIFSRLLKGLSKTMFVAIGTNLIGVTIGIIVGAVTGFYGGLVDNILMRFNDSILAFPHILLALVFISIFGPGEYNVMLALGIVFIPSYARIIRGEYIKCRNKDYIKSAKLMGAGDFRIMFVHVFPNVLPVLVTTVVIGLNNAVLAEAGLTFLGIGVQPPNSSLGSMLSDAQTYIFSFPMYAISIGIVMVIMIIGFALLSDGIKETLDM